MLVENILLSLEKSAFLYLLILVGIFARHFRFITDKGEQDLSKLMVDLFWPALIFSNITTQLNAKDLVQNAWLPLLAVAGGIVGLLVGKSISRFMKFSGHRKAMFNYHMLINNFVFFSLPFVSVLLPRKGPALLFVHNLGMILLIWMVGVPILNNKSDFKENLKNLLTPGFMATLISILFVFFGLQKYIPNIVQEVIETTGKPTVSVSMLIIGGRVYVMGRSALKFDSWNILTTVTRLVIIPLLLFGVTCVFKYYNVFTRETLLIFAIVNIMPVSLNSVSMAIRYKSSPELATQGVMLTHLLSIFTITIHLVLISYFLY